MGKLKIRDDFFENDSILKLAKMEKGHIYINIFLKMHVRNLTNTIHFDSLLIAKFTRNKIEDVEKALEIFKKLDLIEINNDEILMKSIDSMRITK